MRHNRNISDKQIQDILLLLIVISFTITVITIIYGILQGSSLNHVSGTWISLALDLSDGVLYRPLFSETIGFGGTRFFPLFFSIHALLIKFFNMPILTGHLVSLFSGLLLFGACLILFRQMKISIIIAVGLLAILFSELSIRFGMTSIRADILPVAFNVIGIASILSNLDKKYKLIIASIFFTLAFSAKITAVHGIVSVFLWLLFNRKVNEAFKLLVFTSLGYVLFLAILYIGTSGRIIPIFSTCSSGGTELMSILNAPIIFAKIILRRDIIGLVFLVWIFIILYSKRKNVLNDLFFIFWIVSIMITVVILGSPGTDYNHFVDFATASIILIASRGFMIMPKITKYNLSLFVVFLVVAIVYNSISLYSLFADENNRMAKHYPEEVVDFIKSEDGIVISEDPLFPLLADEHPYLLDAFMLRFILLKDEKIKLVLINKIQNKEYSGIIFNKNPVEDIEGYNNAHFGLEFTQAVISNYTLGFKTGDYFVYLPDFLKPDENKKAETRNPINGQ